MSSSKVVPSGTRKQHWGSEGTSQEHGKHARHVIKDGVTVQ